MDELLVPFKTTTTNPGRTWNDERHLLDVKQTTPRKDYGDIDSPARALEVLKAHPQQDDLLDVLTWLRSTSDSGSEFNIYGQTSQASQIMHALVNDVLPDLWSSIHNNQTSKANKIRKYIIPLLSSVSGISMVTLRLKFLSNAEEHTEENRKAREAGRSQALHDTLSVLESILESKDVLHTIWSRLCSSSSAVSPKWLLWKELVILLGNGKVLSTCAEADHKLATSSQTLRERSWLSDGTRFCSWIGYSLSYMMDAPREKSYELQKAWVQMLERALTLGHVDPIVEGTFGGIINGSRDLTTYSDFTKILKLSTKKVVILSLLRILAKVHLNTPDRIANNGDPQSKIRSIAALLYGFAKVDEDIANLLLEWLSSNGIAQDLQIRRAVVAALAEDFNNLKSAVADTLRSFGDKLYIKHTPVLHQEGTTENLLLLVGYAHQKNPSYVASVAQSSIYLNAISNRLAASSHRASVLGMYVGTAVSQLIDPPEKRMDFSSEEMSNPQAQQYLRLTKVHDSVGSIDGLKSERATGVDLAVGRFKKAATIQEVKFQPGVVRSLIGSKVISIEEVENVSETEDEGLPTYAKPDSDASDSDEDPTLVERNKPSAPIYINDIISGLRNTENHDRHLLALTHASPLIRRKAAFGTEVIDSVEELASIFTGLGDKWNIENFQELRLQGLIAVLIAQPLELGQWFSRAYFNGEYSIQQRAAILTTLGLGARELAGFGKEDMALTKTTQRSRPEDPSSFPSKRLPQKLHALYTTSTSSSEIGRSGNAINTASRTLENSILQPMALQARESLSGPNALKVRTFSSRMEVEKRRTKPIPNALAKVVADGFFFPGKHNSPLLGVPLLPLFLKTLSLILHASGPSTLPLPLMTAEFLDLLLSLPSLATGNLSITEALLFAFLTILEINTASDQGRRLAAENGKAVLEMGEWVEGVMTGIRGDGEEEGRVRGLAAGCVGRVREVVEREERVLVGELVGLM
ncbi:MAG: hypothetical protein Q9182_002874 [Xanthomendoza sp. 2 TL-2023]